MQGAGGTPIDPADVGKPLADFTIPPTPKPVTLAQATALGPLGPDPTAATGTLDLSTDPAAVALYPFTLTADRPLWQVSLTTAAPQEGSLPDASVGLFRVRDDSVQVLASDQTGRLKAGDLAATLNSGYLLRSSFPDFGCICRKSLHVNKFRKIAVSCPLEATSF